MWYKRDSIANIIALCDLVRERRVTMDSSKDFAIVMHCNDGSLRRFVEVGGGLYAHDMDNINHHVVVNTTLTQTVVERESQYTHREVKSAKAAQELHKRLGYPSQRDFETLLSDGYFTNSPVTVDDARRALRIYGPLQELLRGKSKHITPAVVPNTKVLLLPAYVLKEHREVSLGIDFFPSTATSFCI